MQKEGFSKFYKACVKIAPAIVAFCSVLSNIVPHDEKTSDGIKFVHEILDFVALNNHDHHEELKLCWKDD